MKKLPIWFISLMMTILMVLIVMPHPPAPVEAGSAAMPHDQAGDEVGAQATYRYLTIAANVFVPHSNNTAFSYTSDGGMTVTGTTDPYMHVPVILPHGAVIHWMKFSYYDNTVVGSMQARLYRQDGNGTKTELAIVSSSNEGYSSNYDSPPLSQQAVDNNLYSYQVTVYWSTASPSFLHLMGVQIYYSVP